MTRLFSTQQQPPQQQPLSLSQKFKKFGKEYGKIGLTVYLSMSATTFSLIYLAIWNGVDVEKIIQKYTQRTEEDEPSTGATAAIYCVGSSLIDGDDISGQSSENDE